MGALILTSNGTLQANAGSTMTLPAFLTIQFSYFDLLFGTLGTYRPMWS